MIFVPCLGGRSHAPDEFAETADVALGAAVLAGGGDSGLDKILSQEDV
jgi:N-carbamoyl-L-amino-acid hydrolase